MEDGKFAVFLAGFRAAETEEKIRLYAETEDLSPEQYRSLLMAFPREALPQLEAALT